uniref:non-specific serine/threonine protein kinase n=1 Tax=Romanomermis culicivorax TaxID=13658 RepID=A0A915KKR4_ROMCU
MQDGEFLRTSCGSPNYAAPEVISGKLYAGPEVDIWSCGVILYAFLCGTLPFDDEHVPTLFRKIKSGVFAIPDYLDRDAVTLICHMLQVDPMKRATVKDIMQHTWFKRDLPAYLFPPVNEQEASIVDMEAVQEVCERYQCSEEEVTAALLNGDPHDHLAICYNLITDNKRIERITDEAASKMRLDDFYAPASVNVPGTSDQRRQHPERMEGSRNISHVLENVSEATGTAAAAGPSVSTMAASVPGRSPQIKRAKWHLGIRSQSRPEDIMCEVFRAMKSLDFEWRLMNPYHVIVRRKDDSATAPKMSLQLYQVDNRSYLLDFKSLADEEGSANSSRHASISSIPRPATRQNRAQSLPMAMDVDGTPPASPAPPAKQSQTMQFFEMSAALISTLAR